MAVVFWVLGTWVQLGELVNAAQRTSECCFRCLLGYGKIGIPCELVRYLDECAPRIDAGLEVHICVAGNEVWDDTASSDGLSTN